MLTAEDRDSLLADLRAQLGNFDLLSRELRCLPGVHATRAENCKEHGERRQSTWFRHSFNRSQYSRFRFSRVCLSGRPQTATLS